MVESNVCEEVYEKKGAEAFNACKQAHASCKTNQCWRDWRNYEKALLGGYDKSFRAFKAKPEAKKVELAQKETTVINKNHAIIGISVGILLVGTLIYFATRKK